MKAGAWHQDLGIMWDSMVGVWEQFEGIVRDSRGGA